MRRWRFRLRPIRFVFRLFSAVALAIAVILAVGDAARSVASSSLQTTPLLTSWLQTAPAGAQATQTWISARIGTAWWDLALAPVLGLPGFVVFGLLALLLYALGRKPSHKIRRIAGAA